jgi:hypothetical protein
MQLRTLFPALTLLSFSCALLADNILSDSAQENTHWQPEEPFKEETTELPDKIDLEDLQPFQVTANDPRFQHFIERGSLQTGSDRVTRFTVVIRSKTGVDNTSYEGFRCGERLYKVYAYGSGERLFAVKTPSWQIIPKDQSTNYRAALYDDLICNLLTGKNNPPDAIFRAMGDNRTLASD